MKTALASSPIDAFAACGFRSTTARARAANCRCPKARSLRRRSRTRGFCRCPIGATRTKSFKKLEKTFVDDLYRNETTGRFVHRKLRLNSAGQEDEEAFRARVLAAATERIDEDKQELFEKTQKKLRRLEDKEARAEAKVADLKGALRASQTAEIADIGATIFGMFTGSRRFTGSKVSRAVKKRSQSARKGQRVERAEDELARVREDMLELQHDVEAKMAELDDEIAALVDEIDTREVRLEKSDIRIERFSILYIPVSRRA